MSLGYWSSGSFLPDLKTRVWVWAWVSWALSFAARCWQCQGRNVGWTRAVGPLLHYTIWPLRTGIRFSFNWNSCRRSLTIALAVTSSFHCPDNPCLFLCRCCLAPGAAVSVWTPHQRCGHCPNSNQHGNFRKLPADYGFCVPALSMPASWGLFCLRLFLCVWGFLVLEQVVIYRKALWMRMNIRGSHPINKLGQTSAHTWCICKDKQPRKLGILFSLPSTLINRD